MRVVADLHVHSKYARATSPRCDIPGLSEGARIKGIDVMATGDFTHPVYFQELKHDLKQDEGGLYPYGGIRFILSTELNVSFELGGRNRRMHHILLAPSLEVAAQINDRLAVYGDLKEDGRPTLKISSAALAEEMFAISKDIMIIPAHIWTPWFSLFGSKGGVDSVEEAFEDQAGNIHALETGLSCYDDKTELLTKSGWKRVSETSMVDVICTLNAATGEIEYQKPIRTFRYRYSGKMYRLRTRRVDICVTPNHNLFYSPCDFRNRKPFRLAEARSLFGKSKRFKKDGKWYGVKAEHFTLPPVRIRHGNRHCSGSRLKPARRLPIRPWLRFFGFWLAEGWTNAGEDGDYNVCVSNNRKEMLDEIRSILESFGYSVYQDKKRVRVRDFQLFYYLKRFGKASDKFIPLEIKSLPPHLISLFFDYYIKGDGHRYGRSGKGLSATTISLKLRDDLQEVALKLGMSAYYKLQSPKGTPTKSLPGKRTYFQSADLWVIYFIRKNEHAVLPSTLKKHGYIERWEDYDGHVYCVEVSNHVVYVRRNGIPVWCGNSDPGMNWQVSALDRYTLVSNSDAHSLEKLGREANVLELETLTYRSLTEAIKTRKGFVKTYEFYPEEGKYHYDGHRDCGVALSPQESKGKGDICPVCRRKLTVGVLHRVSDLADRKPGFRPEGAIPFQHIVPLPTVISKALGKAETSVVVSEEHSKLIRYFGNEFAVYEAPEEQLRLATSPEIADALVKVNSGKVRWIPGHDGVFGKLILDDSKGVKGALDRGQKSLSDF